MRPADSVRTTAKCTFSQLPKGVNRPSELTEFEYGGRAACARGARALAGEESWRARGCGDGVRMGDGMGEGIGDGMGTPGAVVRLRGGGGRVVLGLFGFMTTFGGM